MADQNPLNVTAYCLAHNAMVRPDKTALVFIEELHKAEHYTYQELYDSVCKLCNGLKSLNLPKGSVIAIHSPATYDFLILFLAANAAGLVPLTLIFGEPEDQLNYMLKDSQTRILFQLGNPKRTLNLPANCVELDETELIFFKNFPATPLETNTFYHDPAYLFYTSGSTSLPKGVLHAQHTVIGRKPSQHYWLNLNENDILMHTDNICWTYTMLVGFLDPLSVGATAVVYAPYSLSAEVNVPVETSLQLIQRYKINKIASLPDFYNAVVKLDNLDAYQLPSLELTVSTGEPLADATQAAWEKHFSFPIFTALGMTELSSFISTGPTIPVCKGKIGKIQPNRNVTILPMHDGVDPVPVNTRGMLAIHQDEPGLMIGYLNHPKENNPSYRGDWFLTEDIVSMDDTGYIIYHNRADHLLKVGAAFLVSPTEVEAALISYADIDDVECAVFLDDETSENQLVAYFTTKVDPPTIAEDIFHTIGSKLIDYKIPYVLAFVDALPRNLRGKLDRQHIGEAKVLQRFWQKDYLNKEAA